jgi:chorismate dehydratase
MKKIKVGAVSYLNSKPLIYGFQQGMMQESVEMLEDYPANIAAMLLNDEIDMGLVPVAIIPLLKESYIIGDYCISANGPVASVCLFSDVPIEEIDTLLLDYQSRTSVRLARILLNEYWKISPAISAATVDFRQQIKGRTAGLVIGDRAFEQHSISRFSYDLAAGWKQLTGLPFVFAAWVSNKKLSESFIQEFNEATSYGLQHLDKVVEENPFQLYDLQDYFTNNIVYKLNAESRKGMQLFLEKLASSRPV